MSIYCKIKKKMGRFTLDIEFEAGDETVALMGASGCGKSMTLRCIAGIEKPDSGKIVINGKTVFDSEKRIYLTPQKRRTGYLFQDYALFPNMTVEKNIRTVLPKDRECELDTILTAFHLKGLENHYPRQLSGGQKQRCALARMMVTQPEIIMLDEPFSALDSYLRWQMEQEVVAALEKFGKTVLFVSHDRDEVYRISNQVVVVNHGKNEPIQRKQELYQHPTTYADALLTGCKNICPVVTTGDSVYAAEYGLDLKKDDRSKEAAYIGIRAKLIQPAHLMKASEKALFLDYEMVSVTEGVFNMIVMVRPKDASGLLRWEMPKSVYQDIYNHPLTLAIPREDILLLKNG